MSGCNSDVCSTDLICSSPSPCTTGPRRKNSRPVSRTRSTIASSGSPMRPAPTNCVDRSSVTECPASSEPNWCEAANSAISTSARSEEHTSELQSLMRISYAVFCLKKKKIAKTTNKITHKTKQTSSKYTTHQSKSK